jgi:uncharacterized membrane protein
MHLIPQSWAHWHLLVSVFPSVGLVFVLGLSVAALVTANKGMARACLAAFVILGLLAIPTYLSGEGSMPVSLRDPKTPADLLGLHRTIGWLALLASIATGAAAAVALARLRRAGHLSSVALKWILALGLVTLALMAWVGELGWEMDHHELLIPPTEVSTAQAWSHVHVILNHFPTIGFVVTLGFYVTALLTDNEGMKRAGLALFVICAVLGVPTFVTGNASMWAETRPPVEGISKAVINAHRDMALLSLFGLAFTGGTAWIELFRYRHLGRFSNRVLYAVLGLALVTLGIMTETGHRGGQINHPEIRLATDILPTDPNLGWSPFIEHQINQVVWFVPWQTVHFFGFALIFGTVLLVSLRVLGFAKSVPFSAMHRLLPLGFCGVLMNVFSGMLILQADSGRYLNNITFVPKIAAIGIGGIAVLYFTLSERVWAVGPGEDAPASAKAMAVLILLAWATVIMGGRLLAYV